MHFHSKHVLLKMFMHIDSSAHSLSRYTYRIHTWLQVAINTEMLNIDPLLLALCMMFLVATQLLAVSIQY